MPRCTGHSAYQRMARGAVWHGCLCPASPTMRMRMCRGCAWARMMHEQPAAAAFWLGLALPARPTDRDLGQPARRVAGGTGCAGRSVDLCGGCRSKTAKGGSARQLPFASRTPRPLPRGRVSDFLREACPSEVLNWVRSCCHWQPEAASAPGGGNPKGSWDSGDSVDSASHAVAFGHAAADAAPRT